MSRSHCFKLVHELMTQDFDFTAEPKTKAISILSKAPLDPFEYLTLKAYLLDPNSELPSTSFDILTDILTTRYLSEARYSDVIELDRKVKDLVDTTGGEGGRYLSDLTVRRERGRMVEDVVGVLPRIQRDMLQAEKVVREQGGGISWLDDVNNGESNTQQTIEAPAAQDDEEFEDPTPASPAPARVSHRNLSLSGLLSVSTSKRRNVSANLLQAMIQHSNLSAETSGSTLPGPATPRKAGLGASVRRSPATVQGLGTPPSGVQVSARGRYEPGQSVRDRNEVRSFSIREHLTTIRWAESPMRERSVTPEEEREGDMNGEGEGEVREVVVLDVDVDMDGEAEQQLTPRQAERHSGREEGSRTPVAAQQQAQEAGRAGEREEQVEQPLQEDEDEAQEEVVTQAQPETGAPGGLETIEEDDPLMLTDAPKSKAKTVAAKATRKAAPKKSPATRARQASIGSQDAQEPETASGSTASGSKQKDPKVHEALGTKAAPPARQTRSRQASVASSVASHDEATAPQAGPTRPRRGSRAASVASTQNEEMPAAKGKAKKTRGSVEPTDNLPGAYPVAKESGKRKRSTQPASTAAAEPESAVPPPQKKTKKATPSKPAPTARKTRASSVISTASTATDTAGRARRSERLATNELESSPAKSVASQTVGRRKGKAAAKEEVAPPVPSRPSRVKKPSAKARE